MVTDRQPLTIHTLSKEKMIDQGEILNHVANIENGMKQTLTILQQLLKQVELSQTKLDTTSTAPLIKVAALQHSVDSNKSKVAKESLFNSNDQVLQTTVDKATATTLVDMSKDELDVHFTNIMRKLTQLVDAQDQDLANLPRYAIIGV